MPSEYNPQLVDNMSAKFRRLNNPAHAFADAIGMLQMFPGIVGIWPGSAVGGGSSLLMVSDFSGNGLHLTQNGNAFITYNSGLAGLSSHMLFDGTGDFFSHSDTAVLDILGTETIFSGALRGLTMGGWFRFDATGSGEFLLTKWLSAGNQLSYNLNKTSGDLARMAVSVDGSTVTSVDSISSISASTWYYIVGRFDPSSELAIFLNDEKVANTTSVPASIFNSSADFRIAADGAGAGLFTGRSSLCFLCAAAVPDIFINTFYQMTAPLFGVTV